MKIAVLGGSIAGLLAALVLSREGHDVVVVERDSLAAGSAEGSFAWSRKGVGHFHQPHAFLPRGRGLLRSMLPDVYDTLLENGAYEAFLLRGIDSPQPDDDDVAYLALRRPLIEWALRSAIGQSRCTVRPGVVAGLGTEANGTVQVCGVVLDDGSQIASDLVIDAMGRNSPVPQWLAAAGVNIRAESEPVGCVYYSRYFRLKPGSSICSTAWPFGPRGDAGFAAYATFPGENDTFGVALIPPSWDGDLRVLQHRAPYEAACANIRPVAALMATVMEEPITPVLPMGALKNTFRHYEEVSVPGVVTVGDSYFHTDPMFALGLSNALIHTGALAETLREHGKVSEQMTTAYYGAIYDEAHERYRFACEVAEARERSWRGERVDFTSAAACYPLFAFAAASLASRLDDGVKRKYWRRFGFLDRTDVFDNDMALHGRIEELVKKAVAAGLPQSAPPRDEFLQLVTGAAQA